MPFPWSRNPARAITRADTVHVPLGDVLWAEIDRLRLVITAARETVEEIHPRVREVAGLSDDLLDLWNILKQGEASNVGATSDR
jgi:hypothetical protein